MSRPDSPRIFVPPPLLYAAGLILGLALDGRLAWDFPSASPAMRGIALGLSLIGLALIAAGL